MYHLEKYRLRKISDYFLGLEDKFVGIAILLQIAVHPCPHGQIIDVGYRLLGDNSWAQRTECVHRFAEEKLPTVSLRFLPITRWYVLGHCITEDAILDVVIGDALTFLADHYRQLGFPIDFL